MMVDPAFDFTFADLERCGDAWAREAAGALTPAEERELERLRAPRRRRAWLVARVLARQLLAPEVDAARSTGPLEILSRDDQGLAVRPVIRLANRTLPWSLSITHTERLVGVALARSARAQIGVDLVEAKPSNQSFLTFWFSEDERCHLARSDRWTGAHFWAAKEAAYKATNRGEPFAPRKIVVSPADRNRLSCACRIGTARFHCEVRCRSLANHILAIALAPGLRRRATGAGIPFSRSSCGQ